MTQSKGRKENTEDVKLSLIYAAGGRTFGADWKRSASNLKSDFFQKCKDSASEGKFIVSDFCSAFLSHVLK